MMRLRSDKGGYVCECGTEVAHVLRSRLGESPERLEAWSTRSITMFDRLVLDDRLVPLEDDDPSGLPWYGLPQRALRLAPHKKALRGGSNKRRILANPLPGFSDVFAEDRRGPRTLSLPAHVIASCPERRCRHRKWEIDTAADSD